MSNTDRIEKQVLLKAPQERVWRAISNAEEFGDWFGMQIDGDFVPGAHMRARIKPTKADPEVAKMQEKYDGMPFAFYVDRVEPKSAFAYRWHPFAIDPNVDYSHEPMTLVTFTLEPKGSDTLLTVVESGFDAIPIERRADAFEANTEGWELQMQMIEKYLFLPQS